MNQSGIGAAPRGDRVAHDMTGFRSGSPDEASFVDTIDALTANGLFNELTERSLCALEIEAGNTVLDVGCGTGAVIPRLVVEAGRTGQVTGVDASFEMVEAATRAGAELHPIPDFHIADAAALPFPDDSFDRVRCERTLIYLDDAPTAVREMMRVTRPGGQVVIAEPDLATSIPDSADMARTRSILTFSQDGHGSPWFGRQARRSAIDAGLVDVGYTIVHTSLTDFGAWRRLFLIDGMLARQVEAGALAESEARDWLAGLAAAGDRSAFFWSLTSFIVWGRVPIPG